MTSAATTALAKGWYVHPENSFGQPHGFRLCGCRPKEVKWKGKNTKMCLCPCHGIGGQREPV